MHCIGNFVMEWKSVWTLQSIGQTKIPVKNAINAVTQGYLPNYDMLLVASASINLLFHSRVNTPPHHARGAQHRTDFLLVGGQYTPPCMGGEASLHCSQYSTTLDLVRSHLIPLNTPTPYCFQIRFNIIIRKVACWFISC
jgi:hypothetical protein